MKEITGIDRSSQQIINRMKTLPPSPRNVVCEHDCASVGTSDFELWKDPGVVARPNADAHSPGYIIPGRSIRSKRL